jgi:hypothetical protein
MDSKIWIVVVVLLLAAVAQATATKANVWLECRGEKVYINTDNFLAQLSRLIGVCLSNTTNLTSINESNTLARFTYPPTRLWSSPGPTTTAESVVYVKLIKVRNLFRVE